MSVSRSGAVVRRVAIVLLTLGGAAAPPVDAAGPSPPVIRVDDARRLQPILGVGAAMTNSSAHLIESALTPAARAALFAELFSEQHAGLSFVRVTIGGSDFNAGGVRYSEDDLPPGRTDPTLKHFSLVHDREMIAALRSALAVNPHLRILASPWSAPAWMKSNHSLENVGLLGKLDPRFYAAYAAYLVRFVEGYARAGIPIWAVTVANEPFGVPATYEGMSVPAAVEAELIRGFLRPALRRAHLRTLVLGLDASWDGVGYARTVTGPAGGADGVAWHCYRGDETSAMAALARRLQVLSECAPNLIHAFVGALLADVFDAGANAAALWNLALDPAGGPVVLPNQNCRGCTGLVTIDPARGSVRFSRSLSALGQYGHILRPGAVRIAATQLGGFDEVAADKASAGLHDTAFALPDGEDALVVTNNATGARDFVVSWRSVSRRWAVGARATVTLEWSRAAGRAGLRGARLLAAANA